jgi:hypothetical protein
VSTAGSEPPSSSEGPVPVHIAGGPPLKKRGRAWWQNIEVIGGLAAVFLGLFVVLFVAVLSISLIHDDADKVATIASAAFTVVGTLVGAYFGIKVGTEHTETAMEQTQQTLVLMREEAAKAQAFALWIAPESAEQALEDAQALASRTGPAPP